MPAIAVESKEEILAEIDLLGKKVSKLKESDFGMMLGGSIKKLKERSTAYLYYLKDRINRHNYIYDEVNKVKNKTAILTIMDNMKETIDKILRRIDKIFRYSNLAEKAILTPILDDIARLKEKITAYFG
ncbi:hypothetical protein KY343_04975 [Candidatus Woesearchaeota archaeon]|nr:hypothetical protein [Candidatus Woesearchaeota archaeon]